FFRPERPEKFVAVGFQQLAGVYQHCPGREAAQGAQAMGQVWLQVGVSGHKGPAVPGVDQIGAVGDLSKVCSGMDGVQSQDSSVSDKYLSYPRQNGAAVGPVQL